MVFLRAASQHTPLLGLNVFQVWHLNLFSLKLFMFLSTVSVVTPDIDSFTVPLHNFNGRIVSGIWKLMKIPTRHVSITCIAMTGDPNLFLNQPIIQGWCQPIAGHASMMTSSNENIFALLALCAWNSPVNGEFPSQRPVMLSSIWAWARAWVNNQNACDLRCHRAHYDVIVM